MIKLLVPFLLVSAALASGDLLIDAAYTFEVKEIGRDHFQLRESYEGKVTPQTAEGLAYAMVEVGQPFYVTLMDFESESSDELVQPEKIVYSPEREDIFYSDGKISRHDYRGSVAKGDVLSYEYKRLYIDLPFVPTLSFSRYFNYNPIEITFKHPKDIRIEFELFFPLEEVEHQIERDKRKTVLTLKPSPDTDPRLLYYPYDQDRVRILPRILRNGKPLCQSTPEQFGLWYEDLLKGRESISETHIAQAKTWLGDAQTPIGKAKKLFEYVRDHIEYHANYVAFGAIIPRDGDEVLESGYGDCKDRAFLLHNLGRTMGLDIHMVLVNTRVDSPFDYVKVSDFNHVLCAIKDGPNWVYFDPTAQHYEFADLSANLAGKRALILDGANSQLTQLPMPHSKPVLAIDITVDAANPGEGDAEVRLSQDYLALARAGKLEADDLDQENLLSNLVNYHLRQISLDYFEEVSDSGSFATYRAKADLSKFLVASTKRLYVPSTPFTVADGNLLDRRNDQQGLYFYSGIYVTMTLYIKHQGWQLPQPESLSIGDQTTCGYTVDFQPGLTSSTTQYAFRRLKTQMKADQKAAYLDFTEEYLLMRKKMFRFKRSTP